MELTKDEQAAINFLEKSNSLWNTFSRDTRTLKAIVGLEYKKLIEINEFTQMRLALQKEKGIYFPAAIK